MNDFKPEIHFRVGARYDVPALTGDRPVVILTHAHASRTSIEEFRSMFGSRLKEILYAPDGLLSIERSDQIRHHFWSRHAGRECPTLIAVGGGSTLDLAKSIRIFLPPQVSIASILDRPCNIDHYVSCPLLLMPTTAGTGSEVSSTASLWDVKNKSKYSFHGSAATADWAVIDPELSLTAPWNVTRNSGIDALSHALEVIWNRKRVPKAFAFAMSAAQKITSTLPDLIAHPHDIALRTEMSQASLWAGQAMALTETALLDVLSDEDTLEHGIAHGEASANWLPHVYKLACEASDAMSIYLRAAMEPIICDEWELQDWLINLGYQPILLGKNTPDVDARIKAALQTTRGKNFVTTDSAFALH